MLSKKRIKSADQTAQMGRLVCAFVVHKPSKNGFLVSQPILFILPTITCFSFKTHLNVYCVYSVRPNRCKLSLLLSTNSTIELLAVLVNRIDK